MAKKADILRDPRYWQFVERYYDDLERYVLENCRYTPTYQQLEFLRAVSEPGSRVAVSSGHGTGKSFCIAWILDWHMRVFAHSNAILTATNIEQARSVVWKYLDEVCEVMDKNFPWMSGYFIKETKRYYARPYKDSWYVLPKTASKANPENMAGQHNDNLLIAVDEASGVADPIHGVLMGALTHERNRYLMTSQPTRLSGHFSEAMREQRKKADGTGIWTALTMNSEESPIVYMSFIREKIQQYGGHHSPEYQIKVLGNFPDNMSGNLLARQWCVQCQTTPIVHKDAFGYVLCCDVAEGVHRDSSVATMFRVSGHDDERVYECVDCREYLDLNEKSFARVVASMYYEYPSVTIGVDGDGAGRTVLLELEEMGIPVDSIRWGQPCHTDAARKRYFNLRAYAHCKLKDAIVTERFRGPSLQKFVEQASRLPYRLDERGRFQMLSKDKMKSDGIKSPDISDTCCFVFLLDFIPAEVAEEAHEERNKFLQLARAYMGDDA